jgi:hypothetical protein
MTKELERIIRTVKVKGKLYLRKEDVIKLIQEAHIYAQSLSAKNDLKNLVKALEYGEDE